MWLNHYSGKLCMHACMHVCCHASNRVALLQRRGWKACNYPHLSTPNQRLAGFVQIVSLCAELFEGPPRQVTLSGSNIDRSRNYNGPCGWSEMWVIVSFTGAVRALSVGEHGSRSKRPTTA